MPLLSCTKIDRAYLISDRRPLPLELVPKWYPGLRIINLSTSLGEVSGAKSYELLITCKREYTQISQRSDIENLTVTSSNPVTSSNQQSVYFYSQARKYRLLWSICISIQLKILVSSSQIHENDRTLPGLRLVLDIKTNEESLLSHRNLSLSSWCISIELELNAQRPLLEWKSSQSFKAVSYP